MMARSTTSGDLEWPLVAEVLYTARICPIKYYKQRRQDNVAAQVARRLIYELCMKAEIIPGTIRFMWWWDQDVGW